MPDLTITPANVVIDAAGQTAKGGTAGVTIDAGEICYADTADANQFKLSDSSTAVKAAVVGLAVNSASDEQPVSYVTGGRVNIGAGTVGEYYVVSDTPGKIKPHSDLASGEFATGLGFCVEANIIDIKINKSGAAIPA
jgi:hypothetical protein